MTESQSPKVGERLRSQVCDTEVMVIRASADSARPSCGGSPMLSAKEEIPEPPVVQIDADFSGGSPIGKRFVSEQHSLEVLVVKAGQGTLSIGSVPLDQKEAKPLPASD